MSTKIHTLTDFLEIEKNTDENTKLKRRIKSLEETLICFDKTISQLKSELKAQKRKR